MAYTRTTWNNLSDPPINAENLNKIEQGIYDNSLGIDKINPSGTATTTAEIEEGQINDVIGFKSLKLKGQTSQYTTTGKNIFPRITFSQTINGVTITATGDGTIKIKGTANSSGVNHPILGAWGSSTTLFTIPAGTYTASGIGTRQASPRINIVTNGTTSIFVTNTTQTLDSDTNVTGIFVWVDAETTVDTTFKPMIETGSSATSYEPYTGKKASPNPDFPQDVNNVSGNNEIIVTGENLLKFNYASRIINGITITQNSDNSYKLQGTATALTLISTDDRIKLKANTQYVLGISNGNSNVQISLRTEDGSTQYANTSTTKYITYTPTENITARPFIRIPNGANVNETIYPMVAYGNTLSTYEQYKGNNFDIDLPVENLLDITTADRSNQGVNLYNNHNGTVTLNGKATATSGGLSLLSSNTSLPVSTFKGTVTFSVKEPLPTGVELAFAYGDSTGAWISNIARLVGSTKSVTATINPPSNAVYFRVNFSIATGTELKNLLVCPQLEKGNKANAFTPYGTNPIELCKIGTYADYIYKKDGKWWKHKAIGKITLNGTEAWTAVSTNTSGKYRPQINLSSIVSANLVKPSSNTEVGLILSDHFKAIIAGTAGTFGGHEGMSLDVSGYMQIYDDDYNTNDVSLFKTWLSNNNTDLYWVYSTPIDEEITYAPLLRQLDELYNSGLYDVTNISQDNSSEAFVLDIEACKNNINGIVEYIRR